MDDKNQTEAGSIRISDEAIAVIAGLAALEVEGVASMSQGAVDGIAEMLGVKHSQGRGVKVEVRNEDVVIEINLLVEFGVDIPMVWTEAAEKGTVLWKFRGGPSGRKLLGNGRLISLWAIRGGPAVAW